MSQYTQTQHGQSLIQKESILEDINSWNEDIEGKMIFLFDVFEDYYKRFESNYIKSLLFNNEEISQDKLSEYKKTIEEGKLYYINRIKEW